MKTLLAIDPGLKRTGYAVFKNNQYMCSGVIKVSKKLGWIDRLDFIVVQIINLLSKYSIEIVVVEQPELFIMSSKGRAASNSGAVLKLTALVFSINAMMKYRETGLECVLVSVRKWKGNVPKEITQRRVKRRWGVDLKSLDESDAVGLGTYYIEKVLGVRK